MIYDLHALKKLAGDDERFIIDMLLTFKRTAPPIMDRMEKYDSQQKYEALGREAHKLIPGVSFLGAADLKNELIKIEEGVKNIEEHHNIHSYVVHARKYVDQLTDAFERDFNLGQYE
ncbi:MAG: Hpt domain-containing protein [Bacteroidales bacterium]|nr:Hpt domain-containing protein [Bacteroidales bacterium]